MCSTVCAFALQGTSACIRRAKTIGRDSLRTILPPPGWECTFTDNVNEHRTLLSGLKTSFLMEKSPMKVRTRPPSGVSDVKNIFLPSLLRVTSDDALGSGQPKESKLSRESSLLCPHPPSSVWCWGSSRSEYQLSPKPLSLTLTAFGLDVSCRACAVKKTNKNRQTMSIITFISRSPR